MEIGLPVDAQIKHFTPGTPIEKTVKEEILSAWEKEGETLLSRENQSHHFTASALVMNASFDQVLMVHHNLYQTFSWPGGHVEENTELLAEAIREVKEETGISTVIPMSSTILSLDSLPTIPQQRKGKMVPAHTHFSVGYGCIASEKESLAVKADENSAVRWIPYERLPDFCNEPHMLAIYEKVRNRMIALHKEKQNCYMELPNAILPWFRENARDLPWRKDQDPYHVWISEIMLQQTRVEAVKGYYQRFLERFPTMESLANGEESVLLKLWEGLGYYNRARNLQKAAKMIQEKYHGVFPKEYQEILSLPGIGEYTAGAIASICFGQPTPAVDGNVLRVLARLTEDYAEIDSPQHKRKVFCLLKEIYPKESCGDFTQGLMELGATVCLPNGMPRCDVCPLQMICMAKRNTVQRLLPVKKQKVPRRLEEKTVFVFRCGEQIAVQRRTDPGVLSGLWQFPNVSGNYVEQDLPALLKQWGIHTFSLEKVVQRNHIFTHITWKMICYYIECDSLVPSLTWVTKKEMDHSVTLPTAFRMFLNEK